jgi:hypothetical protein
LLFGSYLAAAIEEYEEAKFSIAAVSNQFAEGGYLFASNKNSFVTCKM